MLRRMKEDVLSDLPPKIIQDYYCDLTPLQSRLYEALTRNQTLQLDDDLLDGKAPDKQLHVFQVSRFVKKAICV